MSELRQAAQAVVDRWDTPAWKDVPHTAEFIDRLRAALSRSGQAASGSQENARSDVQNGVGQPEAPTAAPLSEFYIAGPFHDGTYAVGETATGRLIRMFRGADDIVLASATRVVRVPAFGIVGEVLACAEVPQGAHPPARSGAATKRDHCPEKLKSGGCQLHNLHCGYPKCNEAPIARSGAGSEEAHD